MSQRDEPSGILVEQAASGDTEAGERLLALHRDRLRRMVAIRIDPRLGARVDPSDVVQEVLLEASQRLAEYLRHRPVPFYVWLRQIAWDHLVQVYRQHIRTKKRSVEREERHVWQLPDESVADLADHFVAAQSSPSAGLVRQEVVERVRGALSGLAEDDREVLVLRYLEQLSTEETAAVLGVSASAAKSRHFRAIQRLHHCLVSRQNGESS